MASFTKFGCDLVRGFAVAIGHVHTATVIDQRAGDRCTNSSSRTCDQRDLAVELQIHHQWPVTVDSGGKGASGRAECAKRAASNSRRIFARLATKQSAAPTRKALWNWLLQATLMDRSKPEDLASLGGGGGPAIVALAVRRRSSHQLGVARGEAVGLDAQVVLEAGAAMSACLEAPLVDFPLMAADAGGDPGGAGSTCGELARRKSKIVRRAGIALGIPITNCTCGVSLTSPFSPGSRRCRTSQGRTPRSRA